MRELNKIIKEMLKENKGFTGDFMRGYRHALKDLKTRLSVENENKK